MLLLLLIGLGALASPRVQTMAVQIVTEQLSHVLGIHAQVEQIAYHFPARLRIRGIYIPDQHQDTLVYVDDLYARFRPLALRDNQIRFSRIDVAGVRAYAHMLEGDTVYNYAFLTELFASSDTSTTEFRQMLTMDDIRLTDVRLQYDDMRVDLDDARLALHHVTKDSIDAELNRMHAQLMMGDRTPLTLQDVRARVIFNDTLIAMPTLAVRLPHSTLDVSGLHYIHEREQMVSPLAQLLLHINEARITPADLAFAHPVLGNIDGAVTLTGHLDGTLDSLSTKNVAVYYNNQRIVSADAEVHHPLERTAMFITANCQDIAINTALLQDFVSDITNTPFTLPTALQALGNMHYHGTLRGRITDLMLHGAFRTALGSVTTDGRLRSDSVFRNLRFAGDIGTRRFRLGKLVPESGLGELSLDISTQGQLHDGGFPEGKLHAHVQELQFRDYTYRDICLNGDYARDRYDGLLTVDDENLGVRFNGLFDRSEGSNYDFDLQLSRLNLRDLHLSQQDFGFSMNTHVNLSGFNPDCLSGYLVVDSLWMRHGEDSLLMQQLQVVADYDSHDARPESNKYVQIQSDYLTAKLSGNYAYTTLATSLQKQLIRYLPSVYSPDEVRRIESQPSNNDFQFYVYGRELKALQRFFRLKYRLADFPVLKGEFNESSQRWNVRAYAENIRSRAQRMTDLTFAADNSDGAAHVDVSLVIPADTFILVTKENKNAEPEPISLPKTQITLHAAAQVDSVDLALTITPDLSDMMGANVYYSEGTLGLVARFSRYAGKPLYEINFRPSEMQYLSTPYQIADGRITYCVADTTLHVDNFRISSDLHAIEAAGIASTRASDSLHVRLLHVEAGDLLPLVLPDNILTVQGDLSGWATLYGLFSNPMFAADVTLNDAGLNGQRLGDVSAQVALNRANNTIDIVGDIMDSTTHVAAVTGVVTPAEKAWAIDIRPDSIPLGFINHWTQGILTDIGGYVTGHVDLSGREGDVWVLARVKAHDAGLTIPYTGCHYSFNDSAFMDSTSITFPHIMMRDEEGNPLYINGKLTHHNFANFNLDIYANPQHALAVNLPEKKGEMLAGKVYCDGEVWIYGPDNDIHLDANARTVGKSKFRFSIDGASSAHDNSFITFVDHSADIDQVPITEDNEFDTVIEQEEVTYAPDSKFTLGLNIDGTPELLFQLVINEQTGDMIQARGEGGLRLGMDPSGDISLVGTYTLQSGSLGFTIGNMIRRDFTIAEGSQIIWSGVPEKPVLDVTAKYHVTASLRDLFGEEISSLNTSRTSVPVTCCMTLAGSLENPTIRFALELPMSEDVIQNQVRSVINTEEMLMRQVVYLLVFGRFFTPEYMQANTTMGANEMYSLLSSTITGQINSWLGKLTNVFTMGVNIRTEGEGAAASQEYEAQFQLQPVDRLVINGNVGYRYNDISNRPFFGDVDVEYMLTPNGKVRAKAYTHTVDKYSLRQATTIQGVGFVFRHDFNWPERKPKTAATPAAQDTLSTQQR